jgi:hypothetical protein
MTAQVTTHAQPLICTLLLPLLPLCLTPHAAAATLYCPLLHAPQHEKFQSAPGSRVGTPAYLAPEVILTQRGKTYDGKVGQPPAQAMGHGRQRGSRRWQSGTGVGERCSTREWLRMAYAWHV